MSRERLPPPQPEACLTTSHASRYKGGTLIAEDVWTLGEHQRRLSTPDGYRPDSCPRCGEERVHVHDHLERKPLGLARVVVKIIRYICANSDCRATWRILPAFLARHLWWAWPAVARTVMSEQALAQTQKPPPVSPASDESSVVESKPTTTTGKSAEVVSAKPCVPPDEAEGKSGDCLNHRVPERTQQRWQKRLRSSARQLVVLLMSRGTAALRTLAEGLGLQTTRHELVAAYARDFALDVAVRGACVAALVHRLERGIRLM
jgi:hypothetical protein